MKTKILIWALFLISPLFIFLSCSDSDEESVSLDVIVETGNIAKVAYTSAEYLISVTGTAISECGICWGTDPSPTVAGNKVKAGTEAGSFTGSITGLNPGTLYYIRSYAVSEGATSYGRQIEFTTFRYGDPVINTSGLAAQWLTASLTVIITGDGGGFITERGVCYAQTPLPTVDDNKVADSGQDTGSFDITITGLSNDTKYYLRPYIVNEKGASYGLQLEFSTKKFTDPVFSISFDAVMVDEASFTLNISEDGGDPISEHGVCYGLTPMPAVEDNKKVQGSGTGSFSVQITGLELAEKYYARAYIISTRGIQYGNEVSFDTPSPEPTIATGTTVTHLGWSATLDASLTSLGARPDATITEMGFYYGTDQDPAVNGSKIVIDPLAAPGSFSAKIRPVQGEVYYYVAFAKNAEGTAYGNVESFTARKLIGDLMNMGAVPADSYNWIRIIVDRYENAATIPGGTIPEYQLAQFEKFHDAIWLYGNRRFFSYSFYLNKDTDGNNIIIFSVQYYAAATTTSYHATVDFNLTLDDNKVIFGTNRIGSTIFDRADSKDMWYSFLEYLTSEPFIIDWETDESDLNLIMYPVSDPENYFRYYAARHTQNPVTPIP